LSNLKARFGVVAAVLFVGGVLHGCTTKSGPPPPPDPVSTAGSGGSGAGGSVPIPGSFPGSTGGSGGSGGTATNPPATGGTGGVAGKNDAGRVGDDGPPPPADATVLADANVSGGDDAATPDVAPPAGDAGPGGPLAACFPDPKVIKVCRQLEPACENCPPGGAPPRNKTAVDCFALVEKANAGMASDADCAQFAVDHKCTVDNAATTGNVCGSLNCGATGCNKAMCDRVYGNGDSAACMRLLATCPCK
jgi:hypothetical protein